MNNNQKKTIYLIIIFIFVIVALLCVNKYIEYHLTVKRPIASSSINPFITPSLPPKPSKSKTFAEVPNVPEGTFNYGGSTTWAPIRKLVDKEITTAQPKFRMNYKNPPTGNTPGSNTGIRMLLDNQLDFSVSSRSLNDEEKKQGLIDKKVAIDAIAIAVNPQLNIEHLTVDQLKEIYTGKIKNWNKIVPSLNLEIKPYTRHPDDGGTVDYFLNDVLKINIQELGANVDFTEDTTHGIREVKNNQGGIYYASAPEVVGQCSIKPLAVGQTTLGEFVTPYEPPFIPPDQCLRFKSKIKVNVSAFRSGKYPITRNLFVIIQSNDQRKQLAGEGYANMLLTAQGQQLLENAGYVSIYHTPAK